MADGRRPRSALGHPCGNADESLQQRAIPVEIFLNAVDLRAIPSNAYNTSVAEPLLVVIVQLGLYILLLSQVVAATRGRRTAFVLFGWTIGRLPIVGGMASVVARRKFGVRGLC